MDQPLYDVYFTGKLVEGTDPQAAKASFMQLFKASPETADKFFNGKPQVLKRGLEKAEALKYKAVLHKAGLMVAFKAQQQESPAAAPAPGATAAPAAAPTPDSAPAQAASADQEDWSLAPAGSDVLKPEERHEVPERDIDTSAIKMASAFATTEPEPQAPPPPPDTSHLSAAQAGEDLLPDKPPPAAPPAFNLDDWSLAPAGAELEELKADLPVIDPDTSALSLAEAGADLLEGQTREPDPEPPSTDHLKVVDGE